MRIKAESALSLVFPLSNRESGKKVINFREPGAEDRGPTEVRGRRSGERQRPEVGDLKIKDTNDLIKKIENGELPDKIMLNVHPQRWTDDYVPWVKELVGQNFKNIVKKWMIKFKD